MAVIILNHSQDGERAEVLCDQNGYNRVFHSVEEADAWRWDNFGEVASTSRIIDLDD